MNNFEAGMHYSVLFFVVVVLSLLFNAFNPMEKGKKKVFLWIFFSMIAFLIGFRGPNMGNDTDDYIALFQRVSMHDPMQYIASSNIEPGYILYNWLISRISTDYRILFVVTAIIICYSLGRFAYKYCENIGVLCCMFIGIMQFDFFVSTMRQGLAIAFLLFAYDYMINRKWFRFILICLLAVSFHFSALLFLLLYPLVKTGADKNHVRFGLIVGIVTIFCVLFFDRVLAGLLRLFPKYSYYEGGAVFDGEPRLAVFLKVIVFSLMFLIPPVKRMNKERAEYDIGQKISLVNIATMIISGSATALMRFSALFGFITTSHFSNKIMQFKFRERAIFTMMTLAAFYLYGLILVLLKTPEWQTTYPIILNLG